MEKAFLSIAESVHAAGSVTAPGAGAAICTLTAPSSGTYEVRVRIQQGGASPVAADIGNNAIKRGGGSLIFGAQAGMEIVIPNVAFNGSQNMTVNAIGAATAGVVYTASITATKLSP